VAHDGDFAELAGRIESPLALPRSRDQSRTTTRGIFPVQANGKNCALPSRANQAKQNPNFVLGLSNHSCRLSRQISNFYNRDQRQDRNLVLLPIAGLEQPLDCQY